MSPKLPVSNPLRFKINAIPLWRVPIKQNLSVEHSGLPKRGLATMQKAVLANFTQHQPFREELLAAREKAW